MAKIFLEANEIFPVSSNATIIGAPGGSEGILISGTPNVMFDANVENVDFPGNIADYTYQITGTQIVIMSGSNVVATFPSLNQAATLRFADGSAQLELTGLDAATLGGTALPTAAPAAVVPVTTDPTDISQTADVTPPAPEFDLTAATPTVDEGGNLTFTVTADSAVTGDTTFTYSLAGSGANPANALDFSTATSGTVTIPDGQTEATFTVGVAKNDGAEFAENFTVTLKQGTTVVDTVSAIINDTSTADIEAPVATAPAAKDYNENQVAGAALVTVTATDNIAVTGFEISSGDADGFFQIDSTGKVSLTDAGVASNLNDFETTPNTVTLGVKAIDAKGNKSAEVNVVLNEKDVDDTAPVFGSVVLGGTKAIVTFDEPLSTTSATPAIADFKVTLKNGSGEIAVNAIQVVGSAVELTLGRLPAAGETFVVAYTQGTNAIQDAAGNKVGSFSGKDMVIDTVAPVIAAGQALTYIESIAGATAGTIDGPINDITDIIGTVQVTETTSINKFEIVSGNTSGFFAINTKGQLTLTTAGLTAASNDFETTPNSFTLGIKATDVAGNVSTETPLTVTVTNNTADDNLNPGQTFTLTQNVDAIPGLIGSLGTTSNAGDDIIIAGEGSSGGIHTLGSSDVINGGTGNDRINIKLADMPTAPPTPQGVTPNISSVEKIYIQAIGTTAANNFANLINATSYTELWDDNSTNDLTITNVTTKPTVGVSQGATVLGIPVCDYTVQLATGAITGDLAISMDRGKVNNLFVNATGLAGGAGFTSTTINAITGTGTNVNMINTLDVGATLATVNVIGDGALTINNNLAATVRTIDASTNKGGTNVTLDRFNVGFNNGNVTFTGGEGADRVYFGTTLNLNDKVNGGVGRDIVGVFDETSIITGLQVTNTEILELNTLNGTVTASRIAGIDEVRVTNALNGAWNTATVNGLTSNSTFVTNVAGNATLNITNAQVAGTQDTLNLRTGLGVAGGNVWIQAPGVETISYIQNDLANIGSFTTIDFYDIDGTVDVSTLTITNNTGNTANFDNFGLPNTIKTVNASTSAGSVFVGIQGGNNTNGVAITGGSGADQLYGGDGKDVIIGGAGNDILSGDDFNFIAGTGGAAIPQQSTLTIANAEVGDTFTIGGAPVVWTGVEAVDNAAVIAAINAALPGLAVAADANAVVTAGTFTVTGLADGTAFNMPAVAATNVAATPAAAEVSTVTIDDSIVYDADDVLNVQVNAINFAGIAGQTGLQQANTIAAAINLAGQMTAVVTNPGTDALLTLTGTTVNDYVVASSITGNAAVAAVAQVDTITLDNGAGGNNDLDAGDVINVTVDGVTVNYLVTGVAAADANGLVNVINAAGLGVTALFVDATPASGLDVDDGDSLTLTANAAGTPFVATVQVNNAPAAEMVIATTTPNTVPTIVNPAAVIVAADNAPVAAVAAGANTQTIVNATPINGQMALDQYLGGPATTDTLTGSDGNDQFYVLSGSNGWNGTAFTTMDTITDLNLGGATQVLGVDSVFLSRFTFNAFANTDLINAGTPLAMTGPSLGAAVQALFNAGGALNGSVNDVGLFTYGTDTYLVATDNVAGFTANDALIKVTGVTGTLNLTDIVLI